MTNASFEMVADRMERIFGKLATAVWQWYWVCWPHDRAKCQLTQAKYNFRVVEYGSFQNLKFAKWIADDIYEWAKNLHLFFVFVWEKFIKINYQFPPSVFSLNGELLVDPSAGDAAFTEIAGETFVPACTLGVNTEQLNICHFWLRYCQRDTHHLVRRQDLLKIALSHPHPIPRDFDWFQSDIF